VLTIGLIGGMTCESSAEYYKIINETVRDRLGGIHSAKSIMVSVDFGEVEPLMDKEQWDLISDILIDSAKKVEKGGADFLVLCTNTMHKLAVQIQGNIHIPILDIIDVTAEQIKSKNFRNIGLLGTRFTMEQDFFKDRLREKHGLRTIIPDQADRDLVNRVIIHELSIGKLKSTSRDSYWQIIHKLVDEGAEGVILGCTEIPLLVSDKNSPIPLFDTTKIHAVKAVEYAIKESVPEFRKS